MKLSVVILSLSFFLAPVSRSQGFQDPKQAEFITCAHLRALTSDERDELQVKAESGNAEAQYWMAVLDLEGTTPRNEQEGLKWALRSAQQRYVLAERLYGLISVHSDPALGKKWMLKAAEHGNAGAQFWLGVAYEQDWFGTIDVKEAVRWYQKAAESGDPDAQVELGRRYEDGEGVEQNLSLAAEWYRRAAECVPDLGGAGQGRNRLGLLYMEGRGVPKDFVQAYFWFRLRGSEQNAAEAKEHLSPAQLLGAERLIDEWKRQHTSSQLEAAVRTIEASSR
jgi:TPR repeat protein